ncbi:hypothetical protein SCYAM73S_02857 [Streptomyces cyaneofuscatus]
MATLGQRLRAELPGALADALGVRRVALAADAVTAYAGAVGQRPGAVVAGGTGMIALGTDLKEWRRADGWGHLLGDSGGGAWIGRAGLDAAMRAHDGRRGGSPALLERLRAGVRSGGGASGAAVSAFMPAVLASFAPEVAACAGADAIAAGILRQAAGHVAEAAAAVCPTTAGTDGAREATGEAALTGGLFRMGEPLVAPVREELALLAPGARVTSPEGDPRPRRTPDRAGPRLRRAAAAAPSDDALRPPGGPGRTARLSGSGGAARGGGAGSRAGGDRGTTDLQKRTLQPFIPHRT